MNRLGYPQNRIFPFIIVAITFALYVAVFARTHQRFGDVVASLAAIPVIGGSWYFGIRGGVLTAFLSILANEFVHILTERSYIESHVTPSSIIGNFVLIFVAIIVGRLGTAAHERREALIRLEEFEKDRQNYTDYLESLNNITRIVLEARDMESALKALVERIAIQFKADDGYLALWDEIKKIPVPMVAYGSMRDKYPAMRFEAGEHTLAASVMDAGHPLVIADLGNSPYVDPKLSSLFPNRVMLVLPLIVQDRKLAVLYLGYNENYSFNQRGIDQAEITAQQIALVLTKIQLLEDAQRQVKQLTALHEVALVSTQTESIDQLIERVTEIIGKYLFPDNFGILLMDEEKGVLHPHPSYRFISEAEMRFADVPLGLGVTGQVAQTGISIRVGNINDIDNYLETDKNTISELCIPIKIKDHILGVINTESSKPKAFTPDDELLLGTVAGQLATAIEQLRTAKAERTWLDQLAHSNDLIYAIAQITTRLETTFAMEEIIQRLGAELQKIDLTCIMAIHDPDQETFTINYTSLSPELLEVVDRGLGYPLLHYTFPRSKLMKEMLQPAVIYRPEDEIESLFSDTERSGVLRILGEIGITPGIEPLRLPLIVEGALLGILWIWGREIRNSDLPILSIFARQIGVSLERARLFQEVQNLAVTDPLTGLHNRRSLYELGKIEFARAERLNRPFSCLMVDLDFFKEINDNHGHPFGDMVLQEFARLCRESVREIDLVGRYGGEELLILMPETELDKAVSVAERIRLNIAGYPISTPGTNIHVTTSIGVATRDQNTAELDTLVARADQAMYIAKHRGRNRVAVSK